MRGKVLARYIGESWIVFYKGGLNDLSAINGGLEQENSFICTKGVEGGSHAGGASTNNCNIINHINIIASSILN